jgi:tetratricopeptide (TPR) repeat protein
MDQASAELLKYFRILPDDFIAHCPFPAYFQSIIDFIRAHEHSSDVVFELAICHLALGDFLRAYNLVSRIEVESPEECFVIGFCSFAIGRYEPAIRFLSISEDCEDGLVAFNSALAKAAIFFQQKEYEACLGQFVRVEGLRHPTFGEWDCKFHMAVLSGLLGDHETYRGGLTELDPILGSDLICMQRGYDAASRGDWDMAGAYEAKIVKPSYERSLFRAYVLYRTGVYGSAYATLKVIWRNETERNAGVWILLGMILLRGGNKRDAHVALNNARALRPNDPVVERNLGALLELRQKWDEADEVYRQAGEGDEKNAYARERLRQLERARTRPMDYRPPVVQEVPVEVILRSPAAESFAKFQCTHVCMSKKMMSFLGDVDPVVSEAQRSYTLSRGAGFGQDDSFD